MIYPLDRQDIPAYANRCAVRQNVLIEATMNFILYFIELGDSKQIAELKVTQLSTECSPYLYAFVLGNTNVLIDCINSSNLSFMNTSAKQKITSDLLNFTI